MTGPKIPEIDQQFRDRYTAPHCDSSILHAPGVCQYCDKYPDWQYYRSLANIAFTGAENELGGEHTAPCPSTYFREPEKRDLWGGNVPQPEGGKKGFFGLF
jgi:hypothetical protein